MKKTRNAGTPYKEDSHRSARYLANRGPGQSPFDDERVRQVMKQAASQSPQTRSPAQLEPVGESQNKIVP